jgi:hypothetical protein
MRGSIAIPAPVDKFVLDLHAVDVLIRPRRRVIDVGVDNKRGPSSLGSFLLQLVLAAGEAYGSRRRVRHDGEPECFKDRAALQVKRSPSGSNTPCCSSTPNEGARPDAHESINDSGQEEACGVCFSSTAVVAARVRVKLARL